MFLYLTPKKAGVTKKSQQRRDREEAENEAREIAARAEQVEKSVDNGLFANMKNGADVLSKLQIDKEEE